MLCWFSQTFQCDDLRKNDLKNNLFTIEQYSNLHKYIIDNLYKTVFTKIQCNCLYEMVFEKFNATICLRLNNTTIYTKNFFFPKIVYNW